MQALQLFALGGSGAGTVVENELDPFVNGYVYHLGSSNPPVPPDDMDMDVYLNPQMMTIDDLRSRVVMHDHSTNSLWYGDAANKQYYLLSPTAETRELFNKVGRMQQMRDHRRVGRSPYSYVPWEHPVKMREEAHTLADLSWQGFGSQIPFFVRGARIYDRRLGLRFGTTLGTSFTGGQSSLILVGNKLKDELLDSSMFHWPNKGLAEVFQTSLTKLVTERLPENIVVARIISIQKQDGTREVVCVYISQRRQQGALSLDPNSGEWSSIAKITRAVGGMVNMTLSSGERVYYWFDGNRCRGMKSAHEEKFVVSELATYHKNQKI